MDEPHKPIAVRTRSLADVRMELQQLDAHLAARQEAHDRAADEITQGDAFVKAWASRRATLVNVKEHELRTYESYERDRNRLLLELSQAERVVKLRHMMEQVADLQRAIKYEEEHGKPYRPVKQEKYVPPHLDHFGDKGR